MNSHLHLCRNHGFLRVVISINDCSFSNKAAEREVSHTSALKSHFDAMSEKDQAENLKFVLNSSKSIINCLFGKRNWINFTTLTFFMLLIKKLEANLFIY